MANLSTVFEEADGALSLASGASAIYSSICASVGEVVSAALTISVILRGVCAGHATESEWRVALSLTATGFRKRPNARVVFANDCFRRHPLALESFEVR